jgi:hypothetical protein
MKVFLQDTCFAHCEYSNNPLPPIQFSDDIEWDRTSSFKKDEIIIYTDSKIPESLHNKENKNIAWLIEPRELQPSIYDFIENNYQKFFKILTHDHEILNLPNSVLIPYGGCWVDKKDFSIYQKSKNTSITASSKKFLSGHRLRHECIERFKSQIDIYGRGFNEIDLKLTSLKDYRFHIVVENVKKDFWFTEKIIDAFVTGCIPIYYGCPSIGKFFDIDGILTFNDADELSDILNNLNEDLYLSKMKSIEKNFEIAKKYILAENSIHQFIMNQI